MPRYTMPSDNDRPQSTGFGRRAPPPPATLPGDAGAAGQTLGPERRIAARKRVILVGKIIMGEGSVTVDCVIRDLSSSGIRVRVPESTPLSQEFGLLIVREALVLDCMVEWRRGDQAGLSVLASHDLRLPTNLPRLQWAQRLWRELAPR